MRNSSHTSDCRRSAIAERCAHKTDVRSWLTLSVRIPEIQSTVKGGRSCTQGRQAQVSGWVIPTARPPEITNSHQPIGGYPLRQKLHYTPGMSSSICETQPLPRPHQMSDETLEAHHGQRDPTRRSSSCQRKNHRRNPLTSRSDGAAVSSHR